MDPDDDGEFEWVSEDQSLQDAPRDRATNSSDDYQPMTPDDQRTQETRDGESQNEQSDSNGHGSRESPADNPSDDRGNQGSPSDGSESNSSESDRDDIDRTPHNGGGGDETSDSESGDDEELEEVVPELHPDVYRAPFEGHDVNDPEDIADAVGVIDAQAAVTIEQLLRRVQNLEEKVEHYQEQAKQAQKEFQNFKQRKNDETEQIKATATKDFIKDTLPIRDNLTRALNQDSDDIRSGVELIKQEFDELLEQEGVEIIDPGAGDEVDPSVHEVMTRVESDVEPGRIDECFRPGYKMEDTVIRPARVTVSNQNEE